MKKIKVDTYYWYKSFLGLCLTGLCPILIAYQIFIKKIELLELDFAVILIYSMSFLLFTLNLIGLIKERNFKKLNNNFSKIENDKIIIKSLEGLMWEYTGSTNNYYKKYSSNKKYKLLDNFKVTILPKRNFIGYNIIFYENSYYPRWPYFLAIGWFIEKKMIKELKKNYPK